VDAWYGFFKFLKNTFMLQDITTTRLIKRLGSPNIAQLSILGGISSGKIIFLHSVASDDPALSGMQFFGDYEEAYLSLNHDSSPELKKYQVVRNVTRDKTNFFVFGNGIHTDIIAEGLKEGMTFKEVTANLDLYDFKNGPAMTAVAIIQNESFRFESNIVTYRGTTFTRHYSDNPTLSIAPEHGIAILTYKNSQKFSMYSVDIRGGISETAKLFWGYMNPQTKIALYAQKIYKEGMNDPKIKTYSRKDL
jgi:hypothetical protein